MTAGTTITLGCPHVICSLLLPPQLLDPDAIISLKITSARLTAEIAKIQHDVLRTPSESLQSLPGCSSLIPI